MKSESNAKNQPFEKSDLFAHRGFNPAQGLLWAGSENGRSAGRRGLDDWRGNDGAVKTIPVTFEVAFIVTVHSRELVQPCDAKTHKFRGCRVTLHF